jgi:hypothetical protein
MSARESRGGSLDPLGEIEPDWDIALWRSCADGAQAESRPSQGPRKRGDAAARGQRFGLMTRLDHYGLSGPLWVQPALDKVARCCELAGAAGAARERLRLGGQSDGRQPFVRSA